MIRIGKSTRHKWVYVIIKGGLVRLQADGGLSFPVHVKVIQSGTEYEPRSEKNGLRGFRPGPIQTRLYSHRIWLEA